MFSTINSFGRAHAGGYPVNAAAMQSEIKTFAVKAGHLADQILSQNEPKAYTGPVIIHDHHYYRPWPIFWYDPGPRYVVIDNNTSCSSNSKNRDKDNGAAVLVGIVAAVVAAVGLYSLGSSIAAYNDTNEVLDETYEFQSKLHRSPESMDQEVISQAYEVAQLNERICTRTKNSVVNDMLIKTALVGSAGVALTAAIVSAPALMTGGVIAGLISSGGMLFKWGFDSTDKANLRDAQALKASVSNLNA